jgi:hypothetical protein
MVPPLQPGAMEPYLGEHVSLKVSDTLWIFTVQSLRTLMTKRLAHMCTQYQALSHSLENPNFSVLGNTELSRIILYTVE